ncbi:hypothetical protein QFZ40_002598 [Arthrobacter pascens]|nr:hypothetical protein [Arthrobacter pascens]
MEAAPTATVQVAPVPQQVPVVPVRLVLRVPQVVRAVPVPQQVPVAPVPAAPAPRAPAETVLLRA